MKIIRPLQLSVNHQVLEQNRKFYLIVSATLGINLETGKELLDLDFLKDAFESMGASPLPDMGMPKPNGEFLVSGSFFAGGNQAATGGEVKVKVGNSEKKLVIFGPRKWQAGFPSRPELIKSMPLEYSNSFGGKAYPQNPDGIGYNDGLLPCIEDPKRLVASKNDTPTPAGFSPLALTHPKRMQYQGTYNSDYKQNFFPGYPDDHNWKYFLCAPSDQWIKDYFKGNENFGLYNMHPEKPSIEGTLPGLYARCFVNRVQEAGHKFGELLLNLDTIWLFPEKLLGLLLFRGTTKVVDDEAQDVTEILCAYEDPSQPTRSIDYYKTAFEKRQNSDDDLLINLNTQDLIPDNHKSAMELLMATALNGDSDSELKKNIDKKAEAMQHLADEKMEEAVREVENNLENVEIPDDLDAQTLDIRKLMTQKPDDVSDPGLENFKSKIEAILPGITSGDPQKMVMKDFSFEKIDEIMDAADALAEIKKKDADDIVEKEIGKAKEQIQKQRGKIDTQIKNAIKEMDLSDSGADRIKSLNDAGSKIEEGIKVLDEIDLKGNPDKKMILPRVSSEKIKEQIDMENIKSDPEIPPGMMEALQHVQSQNAMGTADEKTEQMQEQIDRLQQQIRETMETTANQIDEALMKSEAAFKEGYIVVAHFMSEGLSPHKVSLEERKNVLLQTLSNQGDVSNGDWACIDLSGENLDGVNLSGSYLEQVDFSGASLKGADFSGAVMARAVLDNADCTGTNFEGANIGGAHAVRTKFAGSNLKSAILSKGDFTQADFTHADLEDIESFEITIDEADFTQAHFSNLVLLEIHITGAKFIRSQMPASAFINTGMKNCDFSEAAMNKGNFLDTSLDGCNFAGTDLSNACFVATAPEKSMTNHLNFKHSCLKQANFQKMDIRNCNFSYADIENAYFGEANLAGADLTFAKAKNAQFRKADLTGAILDCINLDQGSLAKANMAGASFKKANLFSVDFLRSNISHTDFSWANLDNTLIENWRPE